jgi:hypothetical protein
MDTSLGAACVSVVAFGHDQFGQKSQVRQLFAVRGGGDFGEAGADGGQAQHPAGRIDGRGGGLLGDPTAGGGHDDSRVSSWS